MAILGPVGFKKQKLSHYVFASETGGLQEIKSG